MQARLGWFLRVWIRCKHPRDLGTAMLAHDGLKIWHCGIVGPFGEQILISCPQVAFKAIYFFRSLLGELQCYNERARYSGTEFDDIASFNLFGDVRATDSRCSTQQVPLEV
jgi:hypothetical protein